MSYPRVNGPDPAADATLSSMLEKLRAELIASIGTQKDRDPDLLILHERVSKAINALSA